MHPQASRFAAVFNKWPVALAGLALLAGACSEDYQARTIALVSECPSHDYSKLKTSKDQKTPGSIGSHACKMGVYLQTSLENEAKQKELCTELGACFASDDECNKEEVDALMAKYSLTDKEVNSTSIGFYIHTHMTAVKAVADNMEKKSKEPKKPDEAPTPWEGHQQFEPFIAAACQVGSGKFKQWRE